LATTNPIPQMTAIEIARNTSTGFI
jgi:hypothetical protein